MNYSNVTHDTEQHVIRKSSMTRDSVTSRWQRDFIIIVFIFLFSTSNAIAQIILVTGKVADYETRAPIASASIGIRGKGIGTISNEQGDFELFVPAGFIHDSLFISHVGYTTFYGSVSQLQSGTGVIYLEEAAVILPDVLITDNVLSAAEIVQRAKTNVKQNYPVRKYKVDAFFREIRKENDVYKSLLEAAVTIYDEGYHRSKSKERVYLQEIRSSKKYMNEFNADFWNSENLFKAVLSVNAPRHPDAQSDLFDKSTKYTLAEITQYMDKPVYVLISDTTKNNGWQRKIYVDTATYAIYRSDAVYLPGGQTWQTRDHDSVLVRMTFGRSIQEYKLVEGRLFLSYIMHHVENAYFNRYTNVEIKKFIIQQYLLVNNVETTNLPIPDAGRLMKDYSLQSQVKKYNPEFWKSYNTIKSTPLEKETMHDLEQDKSLEEQFADPAHSDHKMRTIRKDSPGKRNQ